VEYRTGSVRNYVLGWLIGEFTDNQLLEKLRGLFDEERKNLSETDLRWIENRRLDEGVPV